MQNLADLQAKLDQIKAVYGEDLYNEAYKDLQQMLESKSAGSELFEGLKGCLDALTAVEEETKKAPDTPPKSIPKLEQNEALRGFLTALVSQHMPSLRSQAQYDALEAAMHVFCTLADAIFSRNLEAKQQSKKALENAIAALEIATDLTSKLSDVPEAAQSEISKAFKEPPKEYHEKEIQEALLTELGQQLSLKDLNAWYIANRYRMDKISTNALRNELFDRIRMEKEKFREK